MNTKLVARSMVRERNISWSAKGKYFLCYKTMLRVSSLYHIQILLLLCNYLIYNSSLQDGVLLSLYLCSKEYLEMVILTCCTTFFFFILLHFSRFTLPYIEIIYVYVYSYINHTNIYIIIYMQCILVVFLSFRVALPSKCFPFLYSSCHFARSHTV